jgi:hypothetical protein
MSDMGDAVHRAGDTVANAAALRLSLGRANIDATLDRAPDKGLAPNGSSGGTPALSHSSGLRPRPPRQAFSMTKSRG